MKIPRLHVLTDTSIQDEFDHLELARRAIEGGADAIQYRQKTGSTREMIETATRLRDICRRAGVLLLINDRIDVAIAADADGVHLGRDDFPLRLARRLLGPHRILGGSAGTIEEALGGWQEGADYLGCGPMFATGTKADAGPPVGPEFIREVRRAVPLPILGVGGVDATNTAAVLEAGAHGIAVIGAVCASPDPAGAARALRGILDARAVGKETGS